jgi:hypothetical protein
MADKSDQDLDLFIFPRYDQGECVKDYTMTGEVGEGFGFFHPSWIRARGNVLGDFTTGKCRSGIWICPCISDIS